MNSLTPPPAPFISAQGRARIVKILLIVGAILTGLSLLIEALSLVSPPPLEDEELSENLIGSMILVAAFMLTIFDLIIYLVTVVFFAIWLYRAYDNLRAFDPWSRLNYSPGFAVGSFFIPFANLFVPYRAVKELWQKSRGPNEAILSDPPASFPLWWLFWLSASFAGNISFRVSFRENIPPSTATMVAIVAHALFITAAVFAYLVVDAIDKRQEEARGKLNLATLTGPPPPPTALTIPEAVTLTPSPNDSPAS
ncbi:MAG TPA: DUF4328 domain-containing protein [Pyrinomonadaceae bacterium]|nr:DUF4328 domain-containing protein [Pyrinomonadaceae bacterium]